jgi:hypothetical protein
MGFNIFRKNLEDNKALKRKNHVAQGPPSGLAAFPPRLDSRAGLPEVGAAHIRPRTST